MAELYDDADAVVFTSRRETWGLPILEAAAFNRILLASRYEAPYDAIFKEVTEGLCFGELPAQPNASSDWLDGVVPWLTDVTLRRSAIRQNRRVVVRRLGAPRLGRDLKRIVQQLTGNRHGMRVDAAAGAPPRGLDALLRTIIQIRRMAGRPIVVAITAPPHWGKSRLTAKLAGWLRRSFRMTAVSLSVDDFWMTSLELTEPTRSFTPSGIRVGHLVWTLEQLTHRQAAVVPRFTHGCVFRKWDLLDPADVVFVEGIFALWKGGLGYDGGVYQSLQEVLDARFYVETDAEAVFEEAFGADLRRGLPPSLVLQRLVARRRQYDLYVRPTRTMATHVIRTGQGRDKRRILAVETNDTALWTARRV